MKGSKTTFKVDTKELIVYAIDEYDNYWDLNAVGAEINNEVQLIEFINELCLQGYFYPATRDELIDKINIDKFPGIMKSEIKQYIRDEMGNLRSVEYEGGRIIAVEDLRQILPKRMIQKVN